jgi:hypothetical protein
VSVQSEVQRIYNETKQQIYDEVTRQGGTKETVLEVRHLEKMDRILDATSPEEAESLAKRAYDSVFITCLHLRALHKITPKTPEEYRKKADRAESLVKMFQKLYDESEGEPEEKRARRLVRVVRQQERARKLREYAAALTLDPSLPAFEELEGDEEVPEEKVEKSTEKKPKNAPKKGPSMKAARRRKAT